MVETGYDERDEQEAWEEEGEVKEAIACAAIVGLAAVTGYMCVNGQDFLGLIVFVGGLIAVGHVLR